MGLKNMKNALTMRYVAKSSTKTAALHKFVSGEPMLATAGVLMPGPETFKRFHYVIVSSEVVGQMNYEFTAGKFVQYSGMKLKKVKKISKNKNKKRKHKKMRHHQLKHQELKLE